ncbi:anchored repeat-type ABC transporter ATP-binding subunit [Acrocarpospora pleiomorpha]|uniref:Anchored repeat-type ABC transporter ATP-binding subunit n=1 Tax=Acrocarpospora pleiomorpha TaxID=90975 RepID=A0A5M3X8R8_9ACTN|nr:anchored repeat-type ABC transporter ATP-binding subunit [Acrocarpospora pleiomorpha]GES18105.1 anchored repeat-type ABC transporter ATP-binding subunit [Acrocarpospora pleiomorpha]
MLRAEGLTVSLGGRPVLSEASLTLAEGEFTALIGPNGAGKTTFLRSVLGLQPLAAGTVRVAGRPPDQAHDLVGYVPQRHEFAWDFPVTVHGAVLSGRTKKIGWLRRPGRTDRQLVAEAIDRAGLGELRGRPVGELSGGQRQRVLVARTLAAEPRLLLLDEPFTGVDVPTQELLTELFRDLAGEGKTLLMTTHDLAHAAAVCSRIVVLNRTIVADGPPESFADPEVLLRAFGVRASSGLRAAAGDGR